MARLGAHQATGRRALVETRRVGERRLATQPLTVSLEGAPVLTPELRAALVVAEQSGDYAGPVGRLADLYEDGFK